MQTSVKLLIVCLFVSKSLKMSYFSNKPAPTPGSMLPQPLLPSAVVNEPLEKRSLKRKQSASAESGLQSRIECRCCIDCARVFSVCGISLIFWCFSRLSQSPKN